MCFGEVFGIVFGLAADEPGLVAVDVLAARAVASCDTTGPAAISNETKAAAERRANLEPESGECRPRMIPLYADWTHAEPAGNHCGYRKL